MKSKSTKNRGKIDLGPVWAPKTVSGTRSDALGTAFGRPSVAPRPIWGRPGQAKSGQERPKMASRRPRNGPDAATERPGTLAKPDRDAERYSRPALIDF